MKIPNQNYRGFDLFSDAYIYDFQAIKYFNPFKFKPKFSPKKVAIFIKKNDGIYYVIKLNNIADSMP